MANLNIAVISAEVSPFSKAGGLADVAHALPKHLHLLGHEVTVITPYYKFIDQQSLAKEFMGEVEVSFGDQKFPVKFLKTRLSPNSPVAVYFVYQPQLFSDHNKLWGYPNDNLRFAVFNRAVFSLFELLGSFPDVLHCHDWHAGLIPNYLRLEFSKDGRWAKTSTVFTIHNLLYQMQGMWYEVPKKKRDAGRGLPPTNPTELRNVNFAMRGIKYADAINAVSVRYAEEILTKKFGEGLDGLLRRRRSRVFGIINGVDYSIFNPSFDPNITNHYDWNSLDKKIKNKVSLQQELGLPESGNTPLLGMVHRLTEQKGFDLIMDILPTLLRQDVQFVVVGHGDRGYLRFFRQMAKKYPRQVAIHLEFSEAMGSRVYAASDMFLMPSRYEPCGISQLISLRYGSIPIVHHTGGLVDTITDFDPRTGNGTGFTFQTYHATDLLMALVRALETYKYHRVWEFLTWQAMRQSFSWELPARKYVELYRKAIRFHHALE
ncbi:MAG: glycogen synthase [Candidatus Kerfeldbacteria bacterium]|nr:glycogen synthase [Candidatus Kerfeldbacteria bacterium]